MSSRRVSLANGTSRALALDLIRSRGPISRVELADATGLTQATMSTVVRQLIDEGLVAVAGRGESTGGKPPVLLDINRRSRFAVGVQLGSESITYVVVNLSGAILGPPQLNSWNSVPLRSNLAEAIRCGWRSRARRAVGACAAQHGADRGHAIRVRVTAQWEAEPGTTRRLWIRLRSHRAHCPPRDNDLADADA
ncbi:MAG TPA: MarR family transcriptional regulator [Microbacteriaceae bacterium]